tara:strand:+ start:3702 stop:5012 length:1311 start_codon:yes stop_codon:yes gene_type:complete
MSSFLDWLGDALVPKEIAPYLGAIAPMVAPQLGIYGSMALSQLGSFKEREGKFDPYSALATGIALASPQARAIREAGRWDPTKGTVGQRMSAGFKNALTRNSAAGVGTATNNPLMNFLDPTLTTSGEYSSKFLRDQKVGLNNRSLTPYSGPMFGEGSGFDEATTKDFKNKYEAWKYGTTESTPMSTDDFLKSDEFAEYTAAEQAEFKNDLSPLEQKAYIKDAGLTVDTDVAPGYKPKWYETAADMGSSLAGGIMPGFGEYDPITGKYTDFNFGKALQTVAVAGTLGSVMALKDEIDKARLEDEEEERKIWSEWFKSYERTAGHTYENSPYREDHLYELYQRFMMANGGRVGYNMGGITQAAPGVPQGMQLDGREGTFVSQGIKERADDVPAMLSKNEFVLTADAMKGLDKMMGGSGDPRAAAKYMYQTMDRLEAMA